MKKITINIGYIKFLYLKIIPIFAVISEALNEKMIKVNKI